MDDRWMAIAPICCLYHSESNDMQHYSLRPDLISDLRSNFDLKLFRSTRTSLGLPWQEEHTGDKIVALGLMGEKLMRTWLCLNWCLTSLNFELRTGDIKQVTLGQIWHDVPDTQFHCASLAFCHCRCLGLGSGAIQLKLCTFDRKVWKMVSADVIWSRKYSPTVT